MTIKTLRRIAAGALLAALGSIVVSSAAHAGEKITLRLAYTSDSNGYIDACG